MPSDNSPWGNRHGEAKVKNHANTGGKEEGNMNMEPIVRKAFRRVEGGIRRAQRSGTILNLTCILMVSWVVVGCSTPHSVAESEGQGKRRIFHVSYETAWTASRGAAQLYDLRILDLDRRTGYILAKHCMSDTTFGENVAIWVRPLSARQTSVEVVSRHVGPPVWAGWNLEKPILQNIAAMLDE
jgi:hypothetical protein